MFWIALVAVWPIAASLVAWILGTAVALADRDVLSQPIPEAAADVPCPAEIGPGPRAERPSELADAG